MVLGEKYKLLNDSTEFVESLCEINDNDQIITYVYLSVSLSMYITWYLPRTRVFKDKGTSKSHGGRVVYLR